MRIIYYGEIEKLNLEINSVAQIKIVIINFSKQSSLKKYYAVMSKCTDYFLSA